MVKLARTCLVVLTFCVGANQLHSLVRFLLWQMYIVDVIHLVTARGVQLSACGAWGMTGEGCALDEIPHVGKGERVCDISGWWPACVVQL